MPIKFTFRKLPVDAEGKAYASLEEFQAAMIRPILLGSIPEAEQDVVLTDYVADMSAQIVAKKADVMEILELTMDARPSARGQKRPRKAKQETPALALT